MSTLAEIHTAHAASYAAVLARGRVGGGVAVDRRLDGASNEPRDGRGTPPPPPLFWDAVVLTAADDAQAEGFRRQLEAQRLPACDFLVVADPPGNKIGNGGATLVALELLERTYGSARLDAMRVMVIHTGGYSKRLLHVSAVGKIFAAVPVDGDLRDMLYVKLVMYIGVPARMAPGVFVTCADDIELFDSAAGVFDQPGITALAHPSSLTVGETHGVFVLDAPSCTAALADMTRAPFVGHVRRFLHKPTQAHMRATGAVLHVSPASDATAIPTGDMVYTDSVFCIDRATCRRLEQFYHDHQPLQCEIDAYGDFLQALGPDATPDYTSNAANVVAAAPALERTRRALFDALRGVPLHALVLNHSTFYHIGTVPEYLHFLCDDPHFGHELNVARRARVATHGGQPAAWSAHATLMATDTADAAQVHIEDGNSVIEFATLGAGVRIGAGCVLSNVTLIQGEHVPPASFIFVVPVVATPTVHGAGYVALAFGTEDDLKRKHRDDTAVAVAGRTLPVLPNALWPDGADGAEQSLWEARLFPVHVSRAAASAWAVGFLLSARLGAANAAAGTVAGPCISVAQALAAKDVARDLADRQQLLARIASGVPVR